MILINKKVGETPLELIDRLREERPELKDENLSYAGRLDPMAEGQMLILVGDEENKNNKDYLGFDKEYVATFLIGIKTDTGDVLGLIPASLKATQDTVLSNKDLIKNKIIEKIKDFKRIKKQTYPWFSSKTVNGKKLFDHYKEGNPENIERPEREVNIYESELLSFDTENKAEDIKNYIFESINKVNGNFRQEETLEKWEKYFMDPRMREDDRRAHGMTIIEVKLKVSTGTYIRALTEEFDFPVVLLKLNRTKIFI